MRRVAAVLSSALLLVLASCSDAEPDRRPTAAAAPTLAQSGPQLIAVTADGSVVRVDPAARSATVLAQFGRPYAEIGDVIAEDGDSLLVLSPFAAYEETQFVLEFDVRSNSAGTRHSLPDARFIASALVVGPRPGMVTVAGNDGGKVVLFALERAVGAWTRAEFDLGPYNWSVAMANSGASPGELLVSFHGTTTGTERFKWTGAGWTRDCSGTEPTPRVACIAGHGRTRSFEGREYIATGSSRLEVGSGPTATELDLALGENHLMDFAIDAEKRRVFAVGLCNYGRGLTVTDLATGSAERLSDDVCGAKVVLSSDGTLAIATIGLSSPRARATGVVTFFAPEGTTWTVEVPAELVDFLWVD